MDIYYVKDICGIFRRYSVDNKDSNTWRLDIHELSQITKDIFDLSDG